MIILNKSISTKKGKDLDNEIQAIIDINNKVICKALNRRPVLLDKYLEACNNRKDKTRRKQLFKAATELIKVATEADIISTRKERLGIGYSLKGLLPNSKIINIHIREEIVSKNKILFLISTFIRE
ncbi:MAG: hypothetical protein HQK91_07790 [Nitrospirae bacterium]|nr:hypothetical protein [Nitrospirota bacterium]